MLNRTKTNTVDLIIFLPKEAQILFRQLKKSHQSEILWRQLVRTEKLHDHLFGNYHVLLTLLGEYAHILW